MLAVVVDTNVLLRALIRTSGSDWQIYENFVVGKGNELAHASLRFGLGRGNTGEEVDFVVDLVEEKVHRLREMAHAAPMEARRAIQ